MVNSELFYELVKHSLDGISLATENGKIIYVNTALCRLVQRSPEEIIQGGRAILFPLNYKKLQAGVRLREQTGEVRGEIELIDSKGNIIPVEISSASYTDSNNTRYYTTIFRDVRDRKAIENELLESRDRFQALSDSAFEGIIININGVIIDANATMNTMFGYQPGEMYGLKVEDIVTEECVNTVRTHIEHNYEKPYRVKARKKDGEIFPIEICGKNTLYKGSKARITSFRDITDKIAAEKELKRYETKFQTLFQNGSDMLSLLNDKGEYIYVAPSVERILGYKPEELIGKSALDYIHPDDLENALAKLSQVVNDTIATIPDFRFRHANGSYLWLETVLDNMLDNRHVKAISASSRDITQRKLTEIALKQRETDLELAIREIKINEQKFRSLFEQNPDVVFSINSRGIITSVNNTFMELMEIPANEIVGQHVIAFFNVAGNKDVQQEMEMVLSGKANTFLSQFINKIGHVVKVRATVLPIVIDGSVTGAYCVAKNITESWQNEQRLQAVKRLLENAVAPEADIKQLLGVFLWQMENIYGAIECNITLLDDNKLYHFVSPSVPQNKANIFNGIKIPDMEKLKAALPMVVTDVEEEGELRGFKRLLQQAGIEAFIAYPILNSGGEIIGISSFNYRDKNRFSEKHIEIISQVTRVISLIMDNRNALENIRRQNKELVKINTELDRFAYSTSHELRAPLTSIRGLVTLALEEENCGSEMHEYLQMIEKSTQKLEKLVLRIGEFYRNKSTEMNYAPVKVQELIGGVVSRIKQLPEASGINFDINIPAGLLLFSDPQRLEIIFNNLIHNGVLYSDAQKDARFVYISAVESAAGVVFKVEDNGIGVAETCLPKIYNMFYLASEKSAGCGLGLYIVKEVVSRLHGHISMESTLGCGTCVKLVLPTETVAVN